MDSELADESEARCVAHIGIKAPQLGGRVLHQIHAGHGARCGITSPSNKALISALQDCLSNARVANQN